MKYCIVLLLMVLSVSTVAQEIKTEISDVTVYRRGALVCRDGVMSIKKGTHSYYIKGVSPDIDVNSIQVSLADDRAVVLSVNHHYVKVVDAGIVSSIENTRGRREMLRDSVLALKSQKLVLLNESNLILANNKVGTDNGTTVAALSQMAKFYNSELTKIRMSLLEIERKIDDCSKKLDKLVAEARMKAEAENLVRMASDIEVVVESNCEIAKSRVNVSYLVYSASWTPTYDVRVKDVDKPIELQSLGRVRQNTEEEWKDVNLTLSTGDPSVDNVKPAFHVMMLPNITRPSSTNHWGRPDISFVYGYILDQDGNPLPGVAISEKSGNCVYSEKDGTFAITLTTPNAYLNFRHAGYGSQRVRARKSIGLVMEKTDNVEEEDLDMALKKTESEGRNMVVEADEVFAVYEEEELEVSEMTVPRALMSKVDGVQVKNANMQVQQTLTATEFAIKDKYTITSGNKDNMVNMLEYQIEADCYYKAMPRLSQDVYLVAVVPECYKYSFLKGDANLYLNNAYQGKTSIDPNEVQDTLRLSVARDNSIAVSRKEVSSETSKSGISGYTRITKCMEITVMNSKDVGVKVEVVDQYPMSKYSDIKISLVESAGATVDPESGKLTWNVSLAPREQRKIRFTYEIKCPKSSYNIITK